MSQSDVEAIQAVHTAFTRVMQALSQVIVGQEQVVEQLFVALLARGHCLLVGVPGLAKTRIVHALADCLDLEFRRIQFTPDLMPADITGTEVLQENRQTGQRELRFLPGPVFANVLLADEINRTPPKTQAALLEAMQEQQVTLGGMRHAIPEPFFVLATQNPIEQAGTYPLPEAQLDRFLLEVHVDYPNERDELEIVRRTTSEEIATIGPVLNASDLHAMIQLVRRVPIAEPIALDAIRMARSSRPDDPISSPIVRQYVEWGAGPRGSQSLVLAAKARAALRGQTYVSRDDIRAIALPALRHRMRLNYAAHADRITTDFIVQRLLDQMDERSRSS